MRARRPAAVWATVVALALAVGACAPAPAGTAGTVPVQVENNTTIPVGLYVDGTWFGTYPAGASPEVILGAGLDPPLEIELRSPSDTVLAELEVSAEQLEEARMGGLAGAESVALPCGVVSIVVGTLPEDGPLSPTASVAPGPCP